MQVAIFNIMLILQCEWVCVNFSKFKALVHLNSIASENKSLREDLDHLLQERAQFNMRLEKLMEKLEEGKKLAGELTDAATQAYDQR
jgi:regulator of replication initiation timing